MLLSRGSKKWLDEMRFFLILDITIQHTFVVIDGGEGFPCSLISSLSSDFDIGRSEGKKSSIPQCHVCRYLS